MISSQMFNCQSIKQLVGEAVNLRRQAIVYSLARTIAEMLERDEQSAEAAKDRLPNDWIKIQSMSQLRSVVGGRFSNLKQKWLAAGLPLKEHRGDRSAEAALNDRGWVELASWIGEQGFEVKLAGPGDDFFFEVRAVKDPVVNKKGL